MLCSILTACGPSDNQGKDAFQKNANCAPDSVLAAAAGASSWSASGSARLFSVDPRVAARNAVLSPGSLNLDTYASTLKIDRLTGTGVLAGKWVQVYDVMNCGEDFGPYNATEQYEYRKDDFRFQSAMTYSLGDRYREQLNQAGYLKPTGSVPMFAHCMKEDNSFFSTEPIKGSSNGLVCLGDSVVASGNSYADDGTVAIHELQHATTTFTYPYPQGLNQLYYDEAGALNEAVSDFTALLFTEPMLPTGWDPKLFSRWALGAFYESWGEDHSRGAHFCPEYDPRFPTCTDSATRFSADQNRITYAYPDGMGWPYAQNYNGPGYVRSAFVGPISGQQEIHNAAALMLGALWDCYQALLVGRAATEARRMALQLVMETISHLPIPSSLNRTPVTYRAFAAGLIDAAQNYLHWTSDVAGLQNALQKRGLYNVTTITDSSWLSVGTGAPDSVGGIPVAGVKIMDDREQLTGWASAAGLNLTVPQGPATNANNRLDAGEIATIWFDLKNLDSQTAAGVLVDVVILDPQVHFADGRARLRSGGYTTLDFLNPGRIAPDHAQIMYGKVNGSAIVSALQSANNSYNVPTGNTYFKTDPNAYRNRVAALWIAADSSARGRTIRFQVTATPSNGVASTTTFNVSVP